MDGHREIRSLSDGDGHLQLENQEDPEGGSPGGPSEGQGGAASAAMSAERSPSPRSACLPCSGSASPFYALDEVDSLDGVNVERPALIARQAEDAQFMVVSHRRLMIAASERTIGVTQARGAHTQVVGLPDA